MLKVRSYKATFSSPEGRTGRTAEITLNRPGTWDLEPALEFVSLFPTVFHGFNIFTVVFYRNISYFCIFATRTPKCEIELNYIEIGSNSQQIISQSIHQSRIIQIDLSISASQPQICPQSTMLFIFGSSFPSP